MANAYFFLLFLCVVAHFSTTVTASKGIKRDSGECESWRFGEETNTVRDWNSVPSQCGDYVKKYMVGSQYMRDLDVVANQSIAYLDSLKLKGDGKDAWVFDVDETLLSNLPYYSTVGYGVQPYDEESFDKWVDTATALPLKSSRKVYFHALKLGVKIFILTGRQESERKVTLLNLGRARYHSWEELILRGDGDHGKKADLYKSERRAILEKKGFRIIGNSGDQWSDISGFSTGKRTFKLPNPMYYIAGSGDQWSDISGFSTVKRTFKLPNPIYSIA